MRQRTLLALLAFLFAAGASAQPYLDQPPLQNRPADKKVTFWDIQKAFNGYWTDREPSEKESENAEEGGWQQFKRWEWFAMQRTYPSGEFPNPEILYNEYQAYKATHSQGMQRMTGANWSFIGPGVVPGNGGGAGRITCMAIDPTNANTLWVGAACGGLWKSTDGGLTWSSNTDLLPALSISDIVFDPINPQTMYIATGDKYGVYYQYETWGNYSAGVLKSTDGGVTWNPTGMNYVSANVTLIQRLIINPQNPAELFAATNQGIFVTTDGAVTWNSVRTGKYYDIEYKPGTPSTIYAGDSIGFLRSTNSGVTWNYIAGITSTGRTSIAVTPANPSAVYTWAEGGGFSYSNNSGASFTPRTDPSGNCTPYGYYDMVLEVSPINENILFTGGLDIARTTDGGQTWATVSNWSGWPNPDYVHADNHMQLFAPGSATTIYSCNDGGIFRSTDQGATWTDLSTGIDIKQYYRLAGSSLTPSLIYAGAQDNGTDRVTGLATATQVYGADGEECLIDWSNDNVVFVSSQGGNFLRSTDGGLTFNGISAFGCDWTSPITMDPTNNNVIYVGGSDVYQSTDNGVSWNNITNGGLDGSCIYSLEVCASSPNYIYEASFGHIYRSIDGGLTWNNITGTLPVGSAALTGVAVSDANPDAVWVTFSGFSAGNKVFSTTDGGVTWNNVSGTLANIPVNCIEYQNGSNDLLYIGTDFGVFYTDGTMNDWQPYNTNLPNVIVDELEIQYQTSKLRAATYGRGLWETDLQATTLQNIDASALSMTYPPTTTCDTSIAPVVRIRNGGIDTLTTVDLHYRMDALPWQVYNWSGSLATLATTTITLPVYNLSPGVHTFEAYTDNPNTSIDQNPGNDTIVRTFTILSATIVGATPPPIVEGFVSSTFPPGNWTLENSTGILSRSTSCGGYGLSAQSMRADFYNIFAGDDMLISGYVDFTNAIPPIRVFFDRAYAPYAAGYNDSLVIDLYAACPGVGERIYAKGPNQLATAPTTTSLFVPTSSQWQTDTLNLDSLAGHAPMEIRFIAKTGYGNELYIDNINIHANATGIGEQTDNTYFTVFPNPAGKTLNVEVSGHSSDEARLVLLDVLGHRVQAIDVVNGSGRVSFDISTLAEGVYLVQLQEKNLLQTKRVAVIH